MSGRFHIISVHLRMFPGDNAYSLRESFEIDSLSEACAKHLDYRAQNRFIRCSILREGATGHRYSFADCEDIVRAALTEAA